MCAAKNNETAVPESRRSARDRIFEAAKDLFYRHGIRAVGVESIACEADATKMTLYRNFNSKDELVAACMRDHDRDFWAWWDSVLAPHTGDPQAQLMALMAAFSHQCEEQPRGCPMLNAVVELQEEDHPGRAVIVQNKLRIRERLSALCREIEAHDPDTLADALYLLIEGAYISLLVLKGSDTPAEALPRIAETLIAAHIEQ
ncbi:TetR/AcrR family transcriptional regulator [Microbulbifer taiwanensis]|uniref:TetR/AcrR family transcriptional regulator n=1 Tax=Microbulbifer taiwanensis TaxID=986746 RepID=A0ABW1YK87_9GAMM|nr:TetR/AcrR family transcriptional regulator [Microbulbifer taiwanensis]